MEICKSSLILYSRYGRSVSKTFIRFLRASSSSSQACPKSEETFRVYCFGLNEHGALGLKKDPQSNVKKHYPKPVRHFFAEEHRVTDIAAGYGFSAFSVVSKDTFKVHGCGINTDGQIGAHNSLQREPLDILLKPAPINLGLKCPETRVVALSAGRAHLAVLTDNEGVFMSGSNCYGQCGREISREEEEEGYLSVNHIETLSGSKIIDVTCGQDHTVFLTECHQVWTCGWNCDRQTGVGSSDSVCPPCCLGSGDINGEKIVKVAGVCDTVLALNDKGEVFGWGNSEYNQLCQEKDVQHIDVPRALDNLKGLGKIVDIAAGGSFCMVLNEEGDVFVWGYGILGGGPQLQRAFKPFLIPKTLFGSSTFQPDCKVTKIFCGLSHLAAINNYCHLYTWGKNRHGCLGIGHSRDQYFPYKVALSALAEKVLCGVDHTMVLGRSA